MRVLNMAPPLATFVPRVGLAVILGLTSCKRSATDTTASKRHVVGLVTDIGGRGDQSFNDSALRGLEAWVSQSAYVKGTYRSLSDDARAALIPAELRARVTPISVKPVVIQSKVQEDYQPNLQLVVDHGSTLIIGVGFALENAVEAVAKQNPDYKFLLIDSPILDAKGTPGSLPNVRSVVFKEHEGSFLVGALAGLVAKDTLGFVGGMEIPLIKKFEAGFRAGVRTTNPNAKVLVQYTGTFDNVQHGKQAAADLVAKGAEVIFHAAGSDGNGVFQAVKEAKANGQRVFVIGVDSDQSHLAPDATLTSMVKRVDFAVWQAVNDLDHNAFTTGTQVMGLAEGGVAMAEVRVDFPKKAEALATVKALEARIVSNELVVPANETELDAFVPH